MDEVKYLFGSKNPAEYIKRSLEIGIPSGKKAVITRAWLEKTGYTVKDIQFARHRNSYWKKRKLKGNYERNRRRIARHEYSSGSRVQWTEKKLYKFVELTGQRRDYELARYFHTTIPSIQYLRRKFTSAKAILSERGRKITTKQMVDLMLNSEKRLFELARGRQRKSR
jgi:hypothetical protein